MREINGIFKKKKIYKFFLKFFFFFFIESLIKSKRIFGLYQGRGCKNRQSTRSIDNKLAL
jgi:hypothetical protein